MDPNESQKCAYCDSYAAALKIEQDHAEDLKRSLHKRHAEVDALKAELAQAHNKIARLSTTVYRGG